MRGRGSGLRLLFANSIQMFGGAEVWFLTIARALMQRGHWIGLACRPGTELARRAAKIGVSVFPFRFGADVGPAAVARAIRLLDRIRPDAVVTNQDKELRTFGVAARLVGRCPVVHRRAIDHPLKDNWRYRATYLRLARVVVANSQATRRTMLASAPWLRNQRVEVIYNGVDPQEYEGPPDPQLREQWGCGGDDPVIGFVGQLDERKGIETLLVAFERVAKELPSVRLVLAGAGPLAGQVERFRRGTDVGRRVLLLGFRDDVPRILRSVDVLVLPSLWEGFGIVLIEAMAAAKPVVATNVSSIPEIVVHGETGLLVPPGDPEALADALLVLLQDRQRALEMGRSGRARVLKHFSLDRMVNRWEELLLDVAHEKQPS